MKKLRNIFIALGVAVAGLFTSSCLNLDETPYDFITDATLDFTSEKTISELSGNVYSYLRKTYWTYYGMWDWNEDASDLHMFPSRIGVGWGDYYISYHKHEFTPSIESINYVIWYHAYVGIMYANQCLSNQTLLESQPQAVAEIRAVRAFLYYILFDSYRNIMILPEGEVEAGFLPTQVPPQEAFDYIVAELKASIDNLPETNTYDRPSKYMAYMTLAKMHLNYYAWFQDSVPYKETATTLYSGDGSSQVSHYEEALYWSDKVIDGPYTLSANYADNHRQELTGNNEVIFGVNLDQAQATGCYLAPACLPQQGVAAFGISSGWNGGCAIPQFIDTYKSEPVLDKDGNKKDTYNLFCALYGGTGVGKTFISSCIANELMKNGKITARLKELAEETKSKNTAEAQEIQEYLTQVIRGQINEDCIVVESIGDYQSRARNVKKQALFCCFFANHFATIKSKND